MHFAKGHGTGNDFVIVLDADGARDLAPSEVAALCDRRFGIGADGLLRVVRSRELPEGKEILREEPEAEWFMDYRNADGSIAEMCGNGIRVFARFLLASRLATLSPGSTLPIGTRAGVKDVTASATGLQVDLGRWRMQEGPVVAADGIGGRHASIAIDLGNPHVVVLLGSEEELAALDLSRKPVLSPEPPSGANIEFIVPGAVDDGVGTVTMRVYERGVGETLSCGTGVAATALAARVHGGAEAPDFWRVTVPGGTLAVRMFPTEEGEHVGLAGPAELVFTGETDIV